MRIAHGLGIVALLALLAWLLLAKPPAPLEDPAEWRDPDAELAASAEPFRAEPPLRTAVPPILPTPPGDGPLLRMRARDPYGVLDSPHRIWIRQGARNTEPDWIREGDDLATRLEPGTPAPEHLILFFELPDHPLVRARCTPSTQDPTQGFEAELDLQNGVAVVQVTVRGASSPTLEVLTVDVRPSLWRSSLEFRLGMEGPITIVAPAGATMDFRCGPTHSPTHRSSVHLLAGTINHSIELPASAQGG